MTEIFAQPDDLGPPRASELGTGLAASLGAQARESVMGGANLIGRNLQYYAAEHGWDAFLRGAASQNPAIRPDAPDLSIDDARKRVKDEGLDGELKLPEQPTIRGPVLDLMIHAAHERRDYNAAVSRRPRSSAAGALGFATQIGAGMLDPVNLLAFSVPVLGEARLGQILGRAGDSILARSGVRAGVGAAQGAVGTALLQPAEWWLHTQDGQDWTYRDALRNVGLGAVMGGTFHAGLGAFGDLVARARGLPLEGSPEAQVLEGLRAADERAPPPEPGAGAPGGNRTTIDINGERVLDRVVLSDEEARAARDAAAAVHPAEIFHDLPPAAREDLVRAAAADIVADRPGRAGEVLAIAADQDPRIAESARPSAAGGQRSARELPTLPSGFHLTSEPGVADNVTFSLRDRAGKEHYRASVTNGETEGLAGIYGVGWIENVTREHSGLGPAFYREIARAIEQRGGRLVVGLSASEKAARVHSNLADSGLASPVNLDELKPGLQRQVEEAEHASGQKIRPMIVRSEPEARGPQETLTGPGAEGPTGQSTAPPRDDSVTVSRARANRGPRARAERTFSLFEFLSQRGGLAPHPDVQAVLGKNPFVPGFGRLVRKTGMTLDHAREAAVEAGYLHDAAEQHGGVTESTINHLLEALDREARGQRVYRAGEEPAGRIDRDEHLHHIDREIDAVFTENGLDPKSLPDKTRARVVEIMDREGVADPLEAYERALLEEDRRGTEQGQHPADEPIPGWDVPEDTGSAPGEGGPGARDEPGAGGAVRPAGGDDRGPAGRPGPDAFLRLTEQRDPDADADLAASKAAEAAPEPVPPEPAKAIGEAEAKAAEADQILKDVQLSESERAAIDEALAQLETDRATQEQILRDGAACLMEAIA